MENKISTSIQYLYTNVKLFNEVFYNWPKFNEQLKLGPENMKEYFLKEWNELKERLKKDEKIEVKDLDKIVTKDSFDITFIKHYRTLTIEEFLYRRFCRKGYADHASFHNKDFIMKLFWEQNTWTQEKQDIVDEFFNKFNVVDDKPIG
jgi:hypothetical protein